MAIEFRCAQCDKKLKVKDELAGKKIKCPGCGEATAVPKAAAPAKQPLNPELGSTESIINLNLKKFKNRAIDADDEDVNLDELEGAVVLRKRREEQAHAKPPSEPLHPVDWVAGLLCTPVALIMAIIFLAKGMKSRGTKLIILSLVMICFSAGIAVLYVIAIGALALSR